MASNPIVSIRNLTKTFKADTDDGVLQSIDLDIQPRETTLLMGPNGTGKTVLLACIAGGLHPSSGKISILGNPPDEARPQMNLMIQGGMGLPDLSGRENLRFYGGLHPGATDDWRQIVDTMEIADDLDRPVRDYSGGMLRKLELAITMSVSVPLYLLDEPSSGLDLTTINQLHSLIRDAKEDEKTVVMTSHTPLDAEVADRIIILQGGHIVADGTSDSLLEDVPQVVQVVSTRRIDAIQSRIQHGRLFESGDSPRGFLKEGADPDSLEAEFDVTVVDPTYSDMFNYHTQIIPEM